MLSRVLSGAVHGIDAYLVRVEADVSNGIPTFATVGLPQGAVRESEKRVLAALRNSGFEVPPRRITINLAPADVRKEGSAFDLPMAVGILASTGQLRDDRLAGLVLLGELGLDGALRPIRGALPVAVETRRRRFAGLILPAGNVREARVVEGISVYGARTLAEVVRFLEERKGLEPERAGGESGDGEAEEEQLDLADVRGQEHAKRALEVAAAGAHNILMVGPPGSGKTMLARRIPTILPPLTFEESLETTKIHSVAGMLVPGEPLLKRPPFRAPHHTVSDGGLIGGGTHPRPGEISLAHNGVLFLDELPEFRRNVLESMRQPLEDYTITIARAGHSLTYPARILLAAAMNPCPCGYFGDPARACRCPPTLVQRYLGRVSGPLMDRIDIHIEMPAVAHEALQDESTREGSAAVRNRVLAARQRQRARFKGRPGLHANAHMKPRELREFCRVDDRGAGLLKAAISRLGLSARAYHRILRIARTIADVDGVDEIGPPHIAEAIQYRSLDRRGRL